VARPLVSNLLPRPLASPHHLQEVSRSLTDTSLVLSLFVRSVVTKSQPSSSSESCLSSVWFVKLLRTSSLTSVSNLRPSVRSKNLSRRIWYLFSRIPTFAQVSYTRPLFNTFTNNFTVHAKRVSFLLRCLTNSQLTLLGYDSIERHSACSPSPWGAILDAWFRRFRPVFSTCNFQPWSG
jgi:hypothetical protein